MHFERMSKMVYVPGKEDNNKKKKPGVNVLAPARITKHEMMTWIRKAAIDDDTKDELIKSLSRYPSNTMHHFYNNIHQHINRIHAKREKRERAKKKLQEQREQNNTLSKNTDE